MIVIFYHLLILNIWLNLVSKGPGIHSIKRIYLCNSYLRKCFEPRNNLIENDDLGDWSP